MLNDDLISRKALIEGIEEDAKHMMFTSYHARMLHDDMVEFAVNAIECAPTVNAEPVRHATWGKGICCGFVGCSECHDVFINSDWLHDGKWKYCPNCGAKMDLKEDTQCNWQ